MGLNVVHGDETMLHYMTGYDLVFTNSVLCHMSDIKLAMKQLRRIAEKYLITCECVSKSNDYWWIHEYKGKLLYTVDSHLENGATYELRLLKIK